MAFEDMFLGMFGLGFGMFFMMAMLLTVIELIGKIYGTYSSLVRNDLTSEQRLIYLAIIWFIPFGWIAYILLGKEKTAELFSDVRFL